MVRKAAVFILLIIITGLFTNAIRVWAADFPQKDWESYHTYEEAEFQQRESLQLTPGQLAEIRLIKEEFKLEVIPLRRQLQLKRAQLRRLWRLRNPERAAIMHKHGEITDLRIAIIKKVNQMEELIKSVLTPEQQAIFQKRGLRGIPGFAPPRPCKKKRIY